jgi:hypothetical protein
MTESRRPNPTYQATFFLAAIPEYGVLAVVSQTHSVLALVLVGGYVSAVSNEKK